MEPTRKFRILSLDGGGVKGAYTASVLHTIETLTKKSISEHFDLITGTSTGGIIAIAIGLGVPLSKIVDLYVKQGPVIFPQPRRGICGWLLRTTRGCFWPKHSQIVLRQSLEAVLGHRLFGESQNRLVIPSFNCVNGNIHLFKTAHCEHYRMDYLQQALTAALATSAAPTYFPAFADSDGRVFLDGGIWANCPAMVGLVEATANLGWPIDQIEVLSIGTTAEPFDVNRKRRNGGIVQWNKGIIDLIQEGQIRGTLGMASAMTQHRLLRIDDIARVGRFTLDGAQDVFDLKALGENSARQAIDEIASRFLFAPVDPFIPCHKVEANSDISAVSATETKSCSTHLSAAPIESR